MIFFKKHLFLFLFSIPVMCYSQLLNPVKWEAVYSNNSEIIITATIEASWHIYSQKPSDAGPIPTSIVFNPEKNFILNGGTKEENAKENYDKAFEAKLWTFEKKAVFTQEIKRINSKNFSTSIKIEFMACNDMQCLPPKTVELTVLLPETAGK